MARVRHRQRELDEANAVLAVVSAEPVEQLAPAARTEGWGGPVLADPRREVYAAYGLGRLPWHRVVTGRTLLFYLGCILRGRFPQRAGRDVLQQGGDFIVDGDGILRFVHRGRTADDRPSVNALVACLDALRKGAGAVPAWPHG